MEPALFGVVVLCGHGGQAQGGRLIINRPVRRLLSSVSGVAARDAANVTAQV